MLEANMDATIATADNIMEAWSFGTKPIEILIEFESMSSDDVVANIAKFVTNTGRQLTEVYKKQKEKTTDPHLEQRTTSPIKEAIKLLTWVALGPF